MIPLWIKIAYTLFAVVTVAVYIVKYPLANFLWASDIALIMTVPALWLESGLLASMMILGILLPELFWNAGYYFRLLTGKRLSGLTDYMFDTRLPRYLRALSLFHLFLPVLLLWMISRLGYAREALLYQTFAAWIILPLTYLLSDPKLNINGVFGPGSKPQTRFSPIVYLCLVMAGWPLLVYLPTHALLVAVFG